MKKNNKGFTLAELLIVVAIIAVLVAIAIPVFSTQLEKSREGVDAANIRSAYAEVLAARMGSGNQEYYKEVKIKQQTAGWITENDWPENLTLEADSPTNKGGASGKDIYYVVSTSEGQAKFASSNGGAKNVADLTSGA